MVDSGTEDAVRRTLVRFAEDEAAPGGAPRYAQLAVLASRDVEAVRLLAAAPESQRRGTLFFAAIHYVMLLKPEDPLSDWFRGDRVRENPADLLRAFGRRHESVLRTLIATRKTQTNEVRRSAYLVLLLAQVARMAGKSLGIVEPGAAAGLNLQFDRYFFDYGPLGSLGDPSSPVRLAPEIVGDIDPPIPSGLPSVSYRVGMDIDPVDLSDDDEVRWLKACVWAEHENRSHLLEKAIALAREDPPTVVRGDAVQMLADALDDVPADAAICVMHSAFLPYLHEDQVGAFVGTLREYSRRRPIYWIASEGSEGLSPLLVLDEPPRLPPDLPMLGIAAELSDGKMLVRPLLRSAPHGQRLQWVERDKATTQGFP